MGLKGAFAGWEANGETPAMIAARTNSVSALAELVARGAEFDADTLLIHAAAGNAPDAVEWLIARGADIHAGGDGGGTPLHRAAAANAVDAAALLVARGADVDAKNGAGRTPLHRAARRGALGAAEFLVARGADIDAGNGAGETPLHEAARDDWDDWSVAEFLAGRGADVDARGRSGRTPLHYAAWWRSDDLARILVDRGAEVDARDRDGAAPLHYAAQYGSLETAKLLIDRGADVDAGNGAGETPLFGAARRGALDVAALLVDRGADVDATDAWGRTPQDAAFERDRPDIAEWFAERGGTPAESRPEAARAPVEASRFAPGASFRDCAHCPEMVAVPAGRFTMGSPPAEEGRGDDEGPRRIVDFPAPFAVGVHEVTRGEFARFAAATNRATWDPSNPCVTWGIRRYPMLIPNEEELGMGVGPRWRDPGFIQSDGHPAVCVSWSDAHAYAEWLSQETGREYRLLSESEWEYAARAGTTAARYWRAGEAGQCRHANGADLSAHAEIQGAAECDDGYAYTSPVGSFGANAWGLHDVLGNVWEWTRDCATGGYAGLSVRRERRERRGVRRARSPRRLLVRQAGNAPRGEPLCRGGNRLPRRLRRLPRRPDHRPLKPRLFPGPIPESTPGRAAPPVVEAGGGAGRRRTGARVAVGPAYADGAFGRGWRSRIGHGGFAGPSHGRIRARRAWQRHPDPTARRKRETVRRGLARSCAPRRPHVGIRTRALSNSLP